MMQLRKILSLLVLLFSVHSVYAETDESAAASQVVQAFQAQLLSVMQQGDKLNFTQRFEVLKPSVIKTYDLAKITRIVISKEWQNLSKEQKQTLINKFSALSIASYAHYFKSFAGESFKIDSVKQVSPGQIYVHTFLDLPEEQDVSMDYLLKKTGDHWRIINIITNGVSDLALKRSEYVAVLKKSGFDSLVQEISAKIEKFSE